MPLDQYSRRAILNHLFGGPVFTPPGTWYLALFTSSPTDTALGTEVSPTNTNYARVALANNNITFPAAVDGAAPNTPGKKILSISATFPTPLSAAAGGVSWGTCGWWGLLDSITVNAGNLVWYGAIEKADGTQTTFTANPGDAAPSFGAGNLYMRVQ